MSRFRTRIASQPPSARSSGPATTSSWYWKQPSASTSARRVQRTRIAAKPSNSERLPKTPGGALAKSNSPLRIRSSCARSKSRSTTKAAKRQNLLRKFSPHIDQRRLHLLAVPKQIPSLRRPIDHFRKQRHQFRIAPAAIDLIQHHL